MNPKISIAVDSKNKAVATITGMATVGAKIDVEVTGLPSVIPDWATTDKWWGKSLRFRIVDEAGKDLVRFPLTEKSSTSTSESPDGDRWTVVAATSETVETYKTNDGTSTTPEVDFDTDLLRKAFYGVPFNETLEFGVILDSIVDSAQYAVGKIKVRQWASASTEDPTVLPDWRETLAQLQTDLAAVEASKTAAAASATAAASSASSASTYASAAEGSATSASSSASSASTSASTATTQAGIATTKADIATTKAAEAAEQVEKYPYINSTNNHWMVWDADEEEFVDTGVSAKGDKGDAGVSASASVSKTGSVATITCQTGSETPTTATVSDGADGTTPHIGDNGNWFIGTTDTGVHAKGDTGDDGVSPTVTVVGITGGHRVVITDATGSHTFDVMDGTTPTNCATKPTTGSLADDCSWNDIVQKINTLISELKA